MCRIWMRKRPRPERFSPKIGKFLSFCLSSKAPIVPPRFWVDDLQMPKLVQEHLVEHEPPHGDFRPGSATLGAEDSRCPPRQVSREPDSARQCTQGDFAPSASHIPRPPSAPTPVVEVHRPQPCPQLFRQTRKNDVNVLTSHIVSPMIGGSNVAVPNWSHSQSVASSAWRCRVAPSAR